jgi:hypothetical protein
MPLTSFDEMLCHQIATTFDHVGSSDHRFFDRTFFGTFAPDGSVGVVTGMASYNNTNTFEGYAAIHHSGRQYNLRLARPLRPEMQVLEVGPLAHKVLEPLSSVQLTLAPNASGCSFELTWEGVIPPHEELHHYQRAQGRAVQDFRRFDQPGRVSGWVNICGSQVSVLDWFGARDHSWGVRAGMGGYEPITETPRDVADSRNSFLVVWLEFATEKWAGHIQVREDGEGSRRYFNGFVQERSGARNRYEAVDVSIGPISFHPGTAAYANARLHITTHEGSTWDIDAQPLATAWAYRGAGYDRGYDDGRGLGVFRGHVVEHDIYDVSDVEMVRSVDDNRVLEPGHREQPVRLTLNGESGFGHMPIGFSGNIPRYGLEQLPGQGVHRAGPFGSVLEA